MTFQTADTAATARHVNGTSAAQEEEEFVGSIDCGTTSCRFYIFDRYAVVIAQHQIEFKQIYPEPGWHEHDPLTYTDTIDACIVAALSSFTALGFSQSQIKCVGITNQRETTICWDRNTGLPLYNAVAWPDARNRLTVEALRLKSEGVLFDTPDGPTRGEDGVRALTGLPFSTYFAATKFAWMLENVPDVQRASDDGSLMLGTVDSWLLWNYTGGLEGGLHLTDYTNASRTLCLSLHTLTWDPQLLSFFDIPESALPKLVSNSEVYGTFAKGHVLEGVRISGLAGDQQAALVGNRCLEVGSKKQTYGTGCFMLYNTGSAIVKSTHGLLTTIGYKAGPDAQVHYALEGSVAVGGSSITWLRDNLGLIQNPQECGDLAAQVEDTGGVYFVTGFGGLFAPYWDSAATGMLIGLSGYTTKQHICRATLEAVSFQTRAIMEAMAKDAGFSVKPTTTATSSPILHPVSLPLTYSHDDSPLATLLEEPAPVHAETLAEELSRLMGQKKRMRKVDYRNVLKVDGGMTTSDVAMQIQADILGIPVERPMMRESTALGAALLAGSAIGLFGWDVSDPSTLEEVNMAGVSLFEPHLKEEERTWKYAGWNRAIERAGAWKTESGNG